MARLALAQVAVLVGLLVSACGPGASTYCQSGSKYGTQCYAEPDVRQPPGAPRPVDDPRGKPESPKIQRPPGTKLPW